jgi:hypothetical protein
MTMIAPTPKQKAAITRRKNTELRNAAIIHLFTELYQVKRIRFDDTIQELSIKYALSHSTIRKILKSTKTKKA